MLALMSATERDVIPLRPTAPRTTLAGATPRVLRDQVRDALRDAILSAELPPGSRVSEVETALALQVSRTPVREAIRELAQEGLLVLAPHRGAVVATISNDEIDIAYRVKGVLEEEAMGRAAARLTERDLQALGRIVADMAYLVSQDDFLAANEAEAAFHVRIADAADLGLLRRVWASVDDLGRMTTRQLFSGHQLFPSYLAGLVTSHQLLIEVLRSRDPIRAAQAAREHLDDNHRRFLADLETQA
jgi:DNA-binding GntR family transcriptional regulator